MAREIIYRLTDPNFTIYHRAALGGLAATIHSWGNNQPEGIKAKVEKDFIELSWTDEITDKEAIQRILVASFQVTKDKLIDLPGQFIGSDQVDLQIAIHEGLCLTFLQHNKMRSGKDVCKLELKEDNNESGKILSYKGVNSYAHQQSQKTNLLDSTSKDLEPGKIPETAFIRQFAVPGAVALIESKSEEVILLNFLAVACPIFLLRPRIHQPDIAMACFVMPDVIDLLKFIGAMKRIIGQTGAIKKFSNTYLGRVVGGSEEAALRFLVDLEADDVARETGISGCQVITMGKVPWDTKQKNRSCSVRVNGNYAEIGVFYAANTYLAQSKFIKSNQGETYATRDNPIPELVAANLVNNRHWCAQFKLIVEKKEDFRQITFSKEGLIKMKEAIKDQDDKAIIQAFHEAWNRTMGQLGERAREDGLDFNRLVEVRKEKIRNEILRAKTPDALAGWFLRFCASATKGGVLEPLKNPENANRIRIFIFNPRYFDRFQNLLLFALVSYPSKESDNTI